MTKGIRYYDIHVFFSRTSGYSIPIEIESKNRLSDEEVIDVAVEQKLFSSFDDDEMVDSVTEITEDDYNQMKSV